MVYFLEKKWTLEEIRKRVENLNKIISPSIILNEYIANYVSVNDELDALYMTYYNLKDKYMKYKRCSLGDIKLVSLNKTYCPSNFYGSFGTSFYTFSYDSSSNSVTYGYDDWQTSDNTTTWT